MDFIYKIRNPNMGDGGVVSPPPPTPTNPNPPPPPRPKELGDD